jgi:hypothetical protein
MNFFWMGYRCEKAASNQYTINTLTNGQLVKVMVSTANNCSMTSAGIATIVNPIAVVNAGADKIVCANEVISLNGTMGWSC